MPTAKIYWRRFIKNLLCIFLIFIQFIIKFETLNEFIGNLNWKSISENGKCWNSHGLISGPRQHGAGLVQQPLRLGRPKPGTRQGTRRPGSPRMRGSPRCGQRLLDDGCTMPRTTVRARGVLRGCAWQCGRWRSLPEWGSTLGWWNREARWRLSMAAAVRWSPRDLGWSCDSARGGRRWGVSQIARGSVEAALTERGRTTAQRLQIRHALWRTLAGERWNGTGGRGEVVERSTTSMCRNRGRNGGVGALARCAKERRGGGGNCRAQRRRASVGWMGHHAPWSGTGMRSVARGPVWRVVGRSFWADPR
jgi:hypothetical protein